MAYAVKLTYLSYVILFAANIDIRTEDIEPWALQGRDVQNVRSFKVKAIVAGVMLEGYIELTVTIVQADGTTKDLALVYTGDYYAETIATATPAK